MSALLIIGDRLEFKIEAFRKALSNKNYDFIYNQAHEQIEAGASYLNINVGSEDEDSEKMIRLVRGVQERFDNIPICLSSDNSAVLEAGLKVYNNEKSKAMVNSANAGMRKDFLKLAADYDAKIICVCEKEEIPLDETERIDYCSIMLEEGMALGINPVDMFFDPVVVSIKKDQERLPSVLKTIEAITHLGLNTVIGLTNISSGIDGDAKVFIDTAFINMAMYSGLTAAILNPLNSIITLNVFAGENVLNQRIFTQSVFTKTCQRIHAESNYLDLENTIETTR